MSPRPKDIHTQCYDCCASVAEVQNCIEDGHHTMIILRGIPGCGKSHLGRQLLSFSDNGVIFDTFDYFRDEEAILAYEETIFYEYRKKHSKKVYEAVSEAKTPIIVVDTHLEMMDIKAFVEKAVKESYEVYIMEPTTEWKYDATLCAEKSSYGLSTEDVEPMLNKFLSEGSPNLQKLVGSLKSVKITSIEEATKRLEQRPVSSSSSCKTPSPTSSAVVSLVPVKQKLNKIERRTSSTQQTFVMNALIRAEVIDTPECDIGYQFVHKIDPQLKIEQINRCSQTELTWRKSGDRDLSLLFKMYPDMEPITLESYFSEYGFEEAIRFMRMQNYRLNLDAIPEASETSEESEELILSKNLGTKFQEHEEDDWLDNSYNTPEEFTIEEEEFPEVGHETRTDEEFARLMDKRLNGAPQLGKTSIASKLKLQSLFERFPQLPREKIEEMFNDCGKNEEDTVFLIQAALNREGEAAPRVNRGSPCSSNLNILPAKSSYSQRKRNESGLKAAKTKCSAIFEKINKLKIEREQIRQKSITLGNKNPSFPHYVEEQQLIQSKIRDLRKECDNIMIAANGSGKVIDMHYMSPEGAKAFLLRRLGELGKGGTLEVITGHGGSSNTTAKIRGTVENVLKIQGILYSLTNSGKFDITKTK